MADYVCKLFIAKIARVPADFTLRGRRPIQRLLCTAPRRYAHSDDEPRAVPRAQVPRKDRAGVPSTFGQLPNQRLKRVTAYRHLEWGPKVARRVFGAVVTATAHPTTGRSTQCLLFGLRKTFI